MSGILAKAIKKHRSAHEVALKEPFVGWPLSESMKLLAMLVKEMASLLKCAKEK